MNALFIPLFDKRILYFSIVVGLVLVAISAISSSIASLLLHSPLGLVVAPGIEEMVHGSFDPISTRASLLLASLLGPATFLVASFVSLDFARGAQETQRGSKVRPWLRTVFLLFLWSLPYVVPGETNELQFSHSFFELVRRHRLALLIWVELDAFLSVVIWMHLLFTLAMLKQTGVDRMDVWPPTGT